MKGIWHKAAALVSDKSTISGIPGGSSKDRFVLFKSGIQSHMVKCTGCIYKYDDKCYNYKALSICSYAVTTAECNGDLVKYLDLYSKGHDLKPINLFQASNLECLLALGEREVSKQAKKKEKLHHYLQKQYHYVTASLQLLIHSYKYKLT